MRIVRLVPKVTTALRAGFTQNRFQFLPGNGEDQNVITSKMLDDQGVESFEDFCISARFREFRRILL